MPRRRQPAAETAARGSRRGPKPTKICPACGRPFEWRRKWARCWEAVKWCSDRCRAAGGAPAWLWALVIGGIVAGACPAAEIEIATPVDHQVVQRSSQAAGTLRVAGRVRDDDARGATVEARFVVTPDAAWRGGWAVAADGSFSGSLDVAAGGWHPLEVRVVRGSEPLGTAVVPNVGIGEVFVVAGQSNSANHGEERQKPRSGRVAVQDGKGWRLADDPQPGASGGGGSFVPPLGDALVEACDVPVGFICCGIGATSIREWMPAGTGFIQPPTLRGRVRQLPDGRFASDGRAFAMLCERMKSVGPRGFRAVLWHQGESDANQANAACTLPGDTYRELLEILIRDSADAIGWRPPWFVAQVSYHGPEDPGSPDIRAAQAQTWSDGLALQGPDSDSLDGDWREGGGRGVHFSGPGLRRHGELWAERILPWLRTELDTPEQR